MRCALTATSAASHPTLESGAWSSFLLPLPSDPLETSLAALIAGGCVLWEGALAGPLTGSCAAFQAGLSSILPLAFAGRSGGGEVTAKTQDVFG